MAVFIPAVLFVSGILWILCRKDLILFPGSDFTVFSYTDENDTFAEGKSRVDEFTIFPDKLVMRYTLKAGAPYPYVGINLGRKGTFFDISGYHDLKIRIQATKSERLRLFLLSYADGITDNTNYLTYLYLYKEIPLWRNRKEYNLKLKDFYVPEWWYAINNITENDKRIKKNFKKTFAILIERGIALPLDVTDTIELEGLSFSRDKMRSILFFGILLVVCYSVMGICLLWNKHKKRIVIRMHEIIIPYKYLAIEKEGDEDTGKIIEYLERNFRIPELSVKMVSVACSIPAYKIPLLLKEKFKLSFRGYLNSLRMNEARRLLKETGLSITDIAMNIGYNNISHFNNLFRFIENMSPGEFRKKCRI